MTHETGDHLDYPRRSLQKKGFRISERIMNVEEPVVAYSATVPAPPGVVQLAQDLVRRFPECFWFWHPDARVNYLGDARLVVEHLREYGDKRAWEAAKELQKCL